MAINKKPYFRAFLTKEMNNKEVLLAQAAINHKISKSQGSQPGKLFYSFDDFSSKQSSIIMVGGNF